MKAELHLTLRLVQYFTCGIQFFTAESISKGNSIFIWGFISLLKDCMGPSK